MAGNAGSGRRWVALYWVSSEQMTETLHRVVPFPNGTSGTGVAVLDKLYEYRFCFDVERGMWRVDRRRTAPGG
ncbi:MAG: hypothetical protein WCF36_19010 [Candidatus Nanopelagicales bacterium]